jgi:hypothetical protein
MILDTLRQQTLASALSPTRKGGPAAFGFHAGSKTVLTFTRALRWLISAFHSAPVKWTGKVEIRAPLSMMVVETLAAASAYSRIGV